ncbi:MULTISPECIES: hypothetical protein [unclassified Streptomyces]|uniref:hypothetical protein n=1 Tax=unclassified Streptomyces TaxID=2593676 RepID=UPI0003738B6C|nr:hypothetical protein [Streptomyces sp. LaPpAH-202]MYW61000.1 hypothetical protein [Streptomyces sp. SID8370]MYW84894.1 hypothetical protein [Streptomyces sp. SID8371]
MIRFTTTSRLRGLEADRDAARAAVLKLTSQAETTEATGLALRAELDDTHHTMTTLAAEYASELETDRAELEAARAQVLLDAEDRVALRALLRTARRQSRALDRVYVLFRYGRLHSLHASADSAEVAAEAEGAPRHGWTAHTPGAALPPATEMAWRIQPLPLGGAG